MLTAKEAVQAIAVTNVTLVKEQAIVLEENIYTEMCRKILKTLEDYKFPLNYGALHESVLGFVSNFNLPKEIETNEFEDSMMNRMVFIYIVKAMLDLKMIKQSGLCPFWEDTLSIVEVYRHVVRVFIMKEGKVCIGEVIKNGEFAGYQFPGGGVEEGQTVNEALIEECLQEVGIVVGTPVSISHKAKFKHPMSSKERSIKYCGTDTDYYMADFVAMDRSKFNKEGDGMNFQWVEISEAAKMISEGPESMFNEVRIEALISLQNHISNVKMTTMSALAQKIRKY